MFTSRTVLKSLVMAGLAAGATVVSALPAVQVDPGPYNVGDPIVFSVIDSDPYQMCSELGNPGDGFVCAGEFNIEFNPTLLNWMSAAIGPELLGSDPVFEIGPVTSGGTLRVFFDVSLLADSSQGTPTEPTELFSLTFTALAGPTASIRVAPRDPGVDADGEQIPPTYDFDPIETTVLINSAPEPTSSALVALALGAMGFAARRHGRRDND